MVTNVDMTEDMSIGLETELPETCEFLAGIRRAPDRGFRLSQTQTETALKNALRYIPETLHESIAPEFLHELVSRGRIYGYRYRPRGPIRGRPIHEYKGNFLAGQRPSSR